VVDFAWDGYVVGVEMRCNNVFGAPGKCRDRVRFINDIAGVFTDAFLAMDDRNRQGERIERIITPSFI